MNRNLFLMFLFSLTLAGCVSGNDAARKEDDDKRSFAAKPEAVIRSGRKDPLLKADYVLRVLGKPEVKRYEKPSEVWGYPQTGCVLFVYMTEQDDGSKLVRHMEIGTPTFKSKTKDSMPCLKMAAKLR